MRAGERPKPSDTIHTPGAWRVGPTYDQRDQMRSERERVMGRTSTLRASRKDGEHTVGLEIDDEIWTAGKYAECAFAKTARKAFE